MDKENLKEEIVPLKSRLWVSAGDASIALIQTIIGGGALTYYFTRVRGLEPAWAALVWIIFGIWNAVNDPLFGYLSDSTKHKLGRRIPYIRYGAPLIAIAYILSWLSWGGTQFEMFLQFLIFLFFYDILYTAVATSLYIMPYEMAVSNKARGSIFVWKIIFSVIATTLPLILVPILQPGPGDDPTFYQTFHIVLGIIVGVIVFASSYFYEEKHYQQEEAHVPFIESLKNTFKNRSFIIFEIISFTIIYISSALMFGLLFYLDELGIPMAPLFIAMFIGIGIGLFLFIGKTEKLGVKKAMQIMLGSFSLGCFMILFFGRFLIPTMLGFLFVGIGISGGYYLVPMMNGDVIDKDEDMTGQRREGMYAGVNSFITKYAISLAQAVFLWIILLFNYDNSLPKGQQSTYTETGIIIGWVLVPAVSLFLCLITMKWYPLAGPEWRDIKVKLTELHKQKEKAYLEKLGFKYVE